MAASLSTLILLDRYNWELSLDIRMAPEQEAFVPPVLYSLAQSRFENLTPYGILFDDKIVGMIMYGEFSGICWINRIVVDIEYQRMGIGASAVKDLIMLLKGKIRCREIRTSYAEGNYGAARFFEELGFIPISEPIDREIVARYEGNLHI